MYCNVAVFKVARLYLAIKNKKMLPQAKSREHSCVMTDLVGMDRPLKTSAGPDIKEDPARR